MKAIDAKKAIGAEKTPSQDGETLAQVIIDSRSELGGLEIDMSDVAPENLVSTFINAFLHALEKAGLSVDRAVEIRWRTRFASEATRLAEFVSYYVEDSLAT